MNGPTVARFPTQAAIWGSSFTLIKMALVDLAPNQLVLSRLLLGAGVLALSALVTRISLRMKRKAWIHVAISAVVANVVPYMLLSYGELHTSAGIAGVLIGGTPLITILITTLAIRESKVTRASITGFIAGFIGVVLVLAPWSSAGTTVGGSATEPPGRERGGPGREIARRRAPPAPQSAVRRRRPHGVPPRGPGRFGPVVRTRPTGRRPRPWQD